MKAKISRGSEKDQLSIFHDFLRKEIGRIQKGLSPNKKRDFLSIIERQEKKRSSFITSYRKIPIGCESFFVVLRKWNSYTPSLPVTDRTVKKVSQYSIGGGYFLFIQGEENTLTPGYGLVIDPGYNFIHNFGLTGFCLDDIDGILITHAHNDHTNDFESLLSLLYQRNKKFLGKRMPRKIDLFLNVGSFKKFSNYLDLANKSERNYIGAVIVMSPGQIYTIPKRENLDLQLFTLFTNHHEIVTADYALGICFKFSKRIVLLTGDTGWKEETATKNKDFLIRNDCFNDNDKVDVLVPHIGSIIRKEFENKEKNKDFESNYYDNHLGILGTISYIAQWKPEFCIVSEFGEELAGLREKLIGELDKTCKKLSKSIYCIPGDVGLFILLDRKQAICYLSNKPVSWNSLYYKDIKNVLDQDSIKYVSKNKIMKIAYKKRNSVLNKIKIKNGLQKYCECYFIELIKSFKIKLNTWNNILGMLNDLGSFKSEFEDNAFTDPTEVSECDSQITGRLMALSCINDNPEKLLDTMMNGWSSILVLDALKCYHFYVNDLLSYFAIRVYEIGFDVSFSEEDLKNQAAKRNYCEEFLSKYKEMLSYYCKKEQKDYNEKYHVSENQLNDILSKINE